MDNKRFDEAVNLALDEYFSGDCERPHYPEHIAAMRAAILAALPVLLGEPVAELVESDYAEFLSIQFDPDFMAKWSASKQLQGTKLYAPSLGEGDGR